MVLTAWVYYLVYYFVFHDYFYNCLTPNSYKNALTVDRKTLWDVKTKIMQSFEEELVQKRERVSGWVNERRLKDRITPQVTFFQKSDIEVAAERGREERQRRWWRIDNYQRCMWKSCLRGVCERVRCVKGACERVVYACVRERVVCERVVCERVVCELVVCESCMWKWKSCVWKSCAWKCCVWSAMDKM